MVSDRKRMLELGGWLEDCLNPDIQPRNIEKVFNKGLQILGVKHAKVEPDFALESIELKGGESIYEYAYREFYPQAELFERERKAMIRSNGLIELDEIPMMDFLQIKQCNFYFFLLKLFSLKKVFKKLASQEESWSVVFPKWQTSIESQDWNKYTEGEIVYSLKDKYSLLSESICEVGGIFKLSKSFSSDLEVKDYTYFCQIIFARIFFNFLQLGGQYHIGFCSHCDRFIVGNRLKPDGTLEREFCSPRCRTNSKR